MQPRVRLTSVSKKYQLGLTRISLPTLVSNWLRNINKKTKNIRSDNKVFWALKDISFELNPSQSLALIGANGAGKTTILKLLANITQPTSGNIEVNGKLSALIELGAGFHPDLTGRENIFLNGVILGLSHNDIKARFDEIVAFSELEQFIDTPLKRYSSGMKVRLGFAVAATIKPEILLVDEVLSVGDSSFRQKSISRIQELQQAGASIIFVSHNMWLAQSICQSGIYMRKGEMIYYGNISEAIQRYDRELNEQRARNVELAQAGEKFSSGVEITRIEVVGGQILNTDLSPDQAAEVRIHYLAYENIDDVNAVIRILRSDGLTCFMLRTSIDKVKFSLKTGAGVISIMIDPLQLRGGTYYVQAMIRDSYDSHAISTAISDWFYVSGSMLAFNEMNGVFEPNRRWALQHSPIDAFLNDLK
jgi:lipopolysaccharide transport system ATP-binding protein